MSVNLLIITYHPLLVGGEKSPPAPKTKQRL